MSSVPRWHPSNLSKYSTILFDCDGVLWHENTPYAGAVNTIMSLVQQNKRLLFVTNNSGKSRQSYQKKLVSMGFDLPFHAGSIVTSAFATARYLANHSSFDKSKHKVFYIGDVGIREELMLEGIQSVAARDVVATRTSWPRDVLAKYVPDPDVRAVVVGIDDQLSYASVALASIYLQNHECEFIATNLDTALPTGGHYLPGAGACCAAVRIASGREPINMGKPARAMFDIAGEMFSDWTPSDCLMVGDRLDTDILFGNDAGVDTLLVETGISSLKDVEKEKIVPTFVAVDVNQLIEQ